MQVFNAFFKVLNKNKGQLVLYVVIYLSITLLMGNMAQDNEEQAFSGVSLDIGVENKDQGMLGEALVEYLNGSHNLRRIPDNKEKLQDAMYYGEMDYVLEIPEDFSEKFKNKEWEGLLEGTIVPGSNSAYLIENEIEGFLKTAAMYLSVGFGMEEAVSRTAEDMEQEGHVEFLEGDDGNLPVGYYFFQYIPYVFITMMILGVGVVVKTFQNKDLAARNKCSAMPFLKQNLQILLGCFSYMAAVYIIFILMVGCCMADYLFTIQGFLSAVNAFLFAVCALSFSWFTAQLAKNVAILNAISNVFGLGFSFLGGVFVPLEVMGDQAKKMAKFVPSYWYVIANHDIQKVAVLSDTGNVYQSFLMVLVFAFAFLALGLVVNRMKIRGR